MPRKNRNARRRPQKGKRRAKSWHMHPSSARRWLARMKKLDAIKPS